MVFDISSITITDIPVIIALIGAAIYYFGNLIADPKPQKFSRFGMYFEGAIFSVMHIVIPGIVAFLIISKVTISIQYEYVPFILLVVLSLYTYNGMMRRISLVAPKLYKKEFDKKIKQLAQKHKIIKSMLERKAVDHAEQTKRVYLFFSNKYIMFIACVITIISDIIVLKSADRFLIAMSGIFTFLIYTVMPISYSLRDTQYPPVNVILQDGKRLSGEFRKNNEDFFEIYSKNKAISVNKSAIKFIEFLPPKKENKKS